MARKKTEPLDISKKKRRPAINPDAREQYLISLAMDLVEQRLLDGTASSQETTHFLKLGCSKHKYEMEKLQEENKLLKAKTESLQSAKKTEEAYENAIMAFRRYAGDDDDYYVE